MVGDNKSYDGMVGDKIKAKLLSFCLLLSIEVNFLIDQQNNIVNLNSVSGCCGGTKNRGRADTHIPYTRSLSLSSGGGSCILLLRLQLLPGRTYVWEYR